MYNLYFENSRGVRRLVRMMVAEDKLCSAACEETAKINPDYKIYYVRSWEHSNGEIMIDVGSHSEFFIGVPV